MAGKYDRRIPWEAIHDAYRRYAASNRRIAAMFGITEGAIRRKAKRERWKRDMMTPRRLLFGLGWLYPDGTWEPGESVRTQSDTP